ncbi:MAG: hypothetical protein LBU89_08705 [Fibromonadaceae bacterium]|nr:hypothetical protein [Fibromonadaceae bacterium]
MKNNEDQITYADSVYCHLEKLGLGEKLDSLLYCSYSFYYNWLPQIQSVYCSEKRGVFEFGPSWNDPCLSEEKKICLRNERIGAETNGMIVVYTSASTLEPSFFISKAPHELDCKNFYCSKEFSIPKEVSSEYYLKPFCVDVKCPKEWIARLDSCSKIWLPE